MDTSIRSRAALAPPTTDARTYVVGASATGDGHVRRGVACQDRFVEAVLDDGTVLVAVSDGLGSARAAAAGAEAASGAAVRAGAMALRAAPDYPLEDLARHMLGCARAHLTTLPYPLRDLACTLIVAVARGGRVAGAQIGDGASVVEDAAGFHVLTGPPPREYVNEVDPLTAAAWRSTVRVASRDGVRSLAVFTDGCQHAVITAEGTVGSGFLPAVVEHIRAHGPAAAHALRGLLAGRKMGEHSDDDKTLVVGVLAR